MLPAMEERIAALRTLLEAGNWSAADGETKRLLVEDVDIGGYVGVDADETTRISCDLLRAIDDAWTTASGGRFGIAVQNRMLAATMAEGFTSNETWRQFGRDVGWVTSDGWIEADGVLHDEAAPDGHLPWIPGIGTVVNTGRIYEGLLGFYSRYSDCIAS